MDKVEKKQKATTKIRNLHDQVDSQVENILRNLEGKLHCGSGCSDCCLDNLTVFEAEAGRIQMDFPNVLQEKPGPEGACAFLAEDLTCRIYNARPYVCRTQGLPLRWFGKGQHGQIVELRDVCPINESSVDPETLRDDQCFLLGPTEDALQSIQSELDDGLLARLQLRDLF